MKVHVDLDACEGHGDCVMAAPEVFDLEGDDDKVSVLDPEPGAELRAKVERAASVCPVRAITVTD